MCMECYADENRKTPLLNPLDCLENHTQYICGIYELKSEKGRLSYKIFASSGNLQLYLQRNKGKTCEDMQPVFIVEEYREYANTQIRKLTSDEIQKYMSER